MKLNKGDPGYAEPVGLTKERGEKAKNHIYKEIIDLVRNCIVFDLILWKYSLSVVIASLTISKLCRFLVIIHD